MTTRKGELEPGIYAVIRDIENPLADRRVRDDWRYRPKIPKHTRFLVRPIEGISGKIEIVPADNPRDPIYRATARVGRYTPLWDEIVPWLDSVEATVTEQLMDQGLTIDHSRFLAELVKNGLPFDQVIEAVKRRFESLRVPS